MPKSTAALIDRCGQFGSVTPPRDRKSTLQHPSGASTWPLREAGKTLTERALSLIGDEHPAWQLVRGMP